MYNKHKIYHFVVEVLFSGLIHVQAQPEPSNACPPYWIHHGLSCYSFITGLLSDWMEAVVCYLIYTLKNCHKEYLHK